MRIASPADIDAVTETIALAFATDPTWGPALARGMVRPPITRRTGGSSSRARCRTASVFLSDDGSAVAVWIPPGADEMSAEQEEALRLCVTENLDPDAQEAMFALWDRFDSNHPQTEPHAYLSLLATHPDYRGQGIAQALLRENLAGFDARGLPTYLESTNPANDHRYERLGSRRSASSRGRSTAPSCR